MATNARLDKAGATKVAQMANDGIARAVTPAHTMADGDTLFCVSAGYDLVDADISVIGHMAAEAVAGAIPARRSSSGTGLWPRIRQQRATSLNLLDSRPVIALLTDFGTRDHFVGVMKGVIAGICAHARILDVSHDVEPQNVAHGAFLLHVSRRYFPDETIFVCVVDPGVGTERRPVAVRAGGSWFVGPDNGILYPEWKAALDERMTRLSNWIIRTSGWTALAARSTGETSSLRSRRIWRQALRRPAWAPGPPTLSGSPSPDPSRSTIGPPGSRYCTSTASGTW